MTAAPTARVNAKPLSQHQAWQVIAMSKDNQKKEERMNFCARLFLSLEALEETPEDRMMDRIRRLEVEVARLRQAEANPFPRKT